jgi:DNA-binding PadR family transcriptional regulator
LEAIFLYIFRMRRRAGELLPVELAILACGAEQAAGAEPEFHGFAIAKRIRDHTGARRLTAHGTLYKALDRLERSGLLTSRWEDAEQAAAASRPRRRLYHLTQKGQDELVRARAGAAATMVSRQAHAPHMAPS